MTNRLYMKVFIASIFLLGLIFAVLPSDEVKGADNTQLKLLNIRNGSSGLTLSPNFQTDTHVYNVIEAVPYSITAVSVTAVVYDPTSKLYLNDILVNNGISYPVTLSLGWNEITIKVINENLFAEVYQVRVFRNSILMSNRLKSISVNTGQLDTSFDKDKFSYTILVDRLTDYVYFTFLPEYEYAEMHWNGTRIYSGIIYRNDEKLKEGDHTVTITVKAQESSSKSYIFTIKKPYNLIIPGGNQNAQGTFPLSPSLFPTALLTEKASSTQLSKYEVSSAAKLVDQVLDQQVKGPVLIDALPDQEVDQVKVKLSGKLLKAAAATLKTLFIQSDPASFQLEPDTFTLPEHTRDILLTLERSEDHAIGMSLLPEQVRALSAYLRIGAEVITDESGSPSTDIRSIMPNKPLTVTINQIPGKAGDQRKVTVHVFNGETKQWNQNHAVRNADNSVTFAINPTKWFVLTEYSPLFIDTDGHWAENSIQIMAAKGIVRGVSGNHFIPDATITRAEFAAMLARTLQLKEEGDRSLYSDVPQNAWYAGAIRLVTNAGIISGIDEHTFAPETKITREQMAVMMTKAYAYAKGIRVQDMVIPRSLAFSDQSDFSEWARSSIFLSAAAMLMESNQNGAFLPKAEATRAQAVTVLLRLLDRI